MAKILSHPYSSISGSIGGTTYLNGPHHAIIARARVAPVQPGSTNQMLARSSWDWAAAAWDTLLPAVQQDWDIYAQTATFQGKQGNYTVTGRSIFMAGVALETYLDIRLLASPTQVLTAPVITGFLNPSSLSLAVPSAAGTGYALNITADMNDDTLVFIQTSGPKEDSRNFWKGPWDSRQDKAQIVPGGTSTQIDIINLVVDKIYFVRVKCVSDDAPHRISPEWFGRVQAKTTV